MADETPTTFADAVAIDPHLKVGETSLDRIDSLLHIAEPLLGVDRSKGERGYIKHQPAFFFVSKNPTTEIYFPKNHPKAGQSRYAWTQHGEGVKVGRLVEEERL